MSPTKSNKSLHTLKPSHLKAIAALIDGADYQAAASAAGVHRVTLSGWVNHHPAFIAELNRQRKEILRKREDQIRKMDALALEYLMRKIEDGDETTIENWIKIRGLGNVDTENIGYTSSEKMIDGIVESRISEINQEFADMMFPTPGTPKADKGGVREVVEQELLDLALDE